MCLRHWQEPGRFQSKLPHGSDQFRLNTEQAAIVFQSTFPRGSDPTVTAPATNGFISIHAPSRERPPPWSDFDLQWDFNPRSLAGATVYCLFFIADLQDFNPRSLAGATLYEFSTVDFHGRISIHAPSRERHIKLWLSFTRFTTFQSTLPRGSDQYTYKKC